MKPESLTGDCSDATQFKICLIKVEHDLVGFGGGSRQVD